MLYYKVREGLKTSLKKVDSSLRLFKSPSIFVLLCTHTKVKCKNIKPKSQVLCSLKSQLEVLKPIFTDIRFNGYTCVLLLFMGWKINNNLCLDI